MSFVDSKLKKNVFRVDNRGKSLFVEFIYTENIDKELKFLSLKSKTVIEAIRSKVAFVAIKNGEHNSRGYLFGNYKINLKPEIDLKIYSLT